MARHRPLPIGNAHFEHWLELWNETAHQVLEDAPAALMTGYARRIAVGLRVGLALSERPRGRQSSVPVLSEQQR